MSFPLYAENDNLVVKVIKVKTKQVDNFTVDVKDTGLQYVEIINKGDNVRCKADIGSILVIAKDVTKYTFNYNSDDYLVINSRDIRCFIPASDFEEFLTSVV